MKAAIEKCLCALAKERSLFYSEADFQFSFAWKFREQNQGCSIRLEVPLGIDEKAHLDVLVMAKERVGIELKYHKGELTTTINTEQFVFSGKAPRDVARHGFLKDIERLERVVPDFCAAGFALMLTNDARLWADPGIARCIDREFDLSEDRIVSGRLDWAEHASPGSRRGVIELKGCYACNWREFSRVAGRKGEFRYLLIEVPAR